ncbi:MAG: hypothetical protein P4L91_06460 [Burkholderiaceae bacterium]|nr:hypothetical protein [Burkholderiaceae bacterium]
MKEIDTNAVLLGKLLAEVYRVQRNLGVATMDDATIYALRNGFETAIDDELERIGFVSKAQVKHVMDVLDPIWQDPTQLAAFKGFYDIERELEDGGVDRPTAITVLTYLNAKGQFTEVIAKMDTSHSPSECRTFELGKWEL